MKNLYQKKIYFIYNPVAGKGQIMQYMKDIDTYLLTHNVSYTKYATHSVLDAYRQVKKIVDDYDVLLISGGDGTLNEVVQALAEVSKKPLIMYLPCGTTNDFGKSLNLSHNPLKNIVHYFESGTQISIDMGKLNKRYFTYVAAFGNISEIAYTTPQKAKHHLGRGAYVLEGVKRFIQSKTQHLYISHDKGVYEDDFFFGFVSNAYQVGGFEFFDRRDIQMNDGYFECVFVKRPKNPIDLQRLLYALTQHEYENNPFIYTCKTKELIIHSKTALSWTIDGEDAGSYKDSHILNIPKSLRFIK